MIRMQLKPSLFTFLTRPGYPLRVVDPTLWDLLLASFCLYGFYSTIIYNHVLSSLHFLPYRQVSSQAYKHVTRVESVAETFCCIGYTGSPPNCISKS